MPENYISEMKDELFVQLFFAIFLMQKEKGGILLKLYYTLW